MSVLSMDFSNTCIKFVEGSFQDNKLSVTKCATVELPATAYNGNNIGDPGVFSDVIKNAVNDNGFTSKMASVTIANNSIIYKVLDAPKIKVPKVLAKVIANEMKKNIMNSQEVMVADYIQLKENGNTLNVFGIMMPRDIVESYQRLLLDCNLQPVSMQVYTSSLFNLITEFYDFSELPGYIFANILSNKELHIVMFEKYESIFTRTVKIETDALDIRYGMADNDLDSVASSVVDHISKMIQFQSSKNRHAPIKKVFLVGELSDDEQFVGRVSAGLIDVETLSFSSQGNISISPSTSFSQYAVGIGGLMC